MPFSLTTLVTTDDDGNELATVTLRLEWEFVPGYRDTWDEPGQGDAITLQSVAYLDDGVFRGIVRHTPLDPLNHRYALAERWIDLHEPELIEQAKADAAPDPDEQRERAFDARGGGAVVKLTPSETGFLNLLMRSPDRGDGWRTVSPTLWRLVDGFGRRELLETDGSAGSGGKVRLSERGRVLLEYL